MVKGDVLSRGSSDCNGALDFIMGGEGGDVTGTAVAIFEVNVDVSLGGRSEAADTASDGGLAGGCRHVGL